MTPAIVAPRVLRATTLWRARQRAARILGHRLTARQHPRGAEALERAELFGHPTRQGLAHQCPTCRQWFLACVEIAWTAHQTAFGTIPAGQRREWVLRCRPCRDAR